MRADFSSGEKYSNQNYEESMWKGKGYRRGDNTGKKQNDTFTDAAQMDELRKMKLREQEESTESSHDPQPTKDNVRRDPTT
jgi:hypothetical protein